MSIGKNIRSIWMRSIVWALFVFSFMLAGHALPADTANDQPLNFVFILADDLGWSDLTCYGSTFYETPNIDKLAGQGMRFTDAYSAAPLCSATRASLMTGKYPARLHVTAAFVYPRWAKGKKVKPRPKPWRKLVVPDEPDRLPLEEFTIAEALKSAGYVTAHFGKWHLGLKPCYPENQGFDINMGGVHRGWPPSHFDPYTRALPNSKEVLDIENLQGRNPGEYLADRLTDEALKFIENNKDRRFFCYLPHYAVHTPIQAKEELIPKYEAKVKPNDPQNNPTYAAMIQSLDESVGRIMDKLDELKLTKRTIVIFTSDNGGLLVTPSANATTRITSNAPLRGGKATLFEGGIRVPLIVRWPDVVKRGSNCKVPVNTVDFYPTLLEMAGIQSDPKQTLDGESIVPLLKQTGQLKRDAVYFHFPHYIAGHHQPEPKLRQYWTKPVSAIRQGDYKLLYFDEDKSVELYNLKKDIGETINLAEQASEKAKALKKKLLTWRESVGAQLCTSNPTYDPDYVYQPPAKNRENPKQKK